MFDRPLYIEIISIPPHYMADLKNPEDSLAQEVNASDENTLVWYRSNATKI